MTEKIPFWRDQRVLRLLGQVIVLLIVVAIIAVLGNNLSRNLQRLGLKFGFEFLSRPASFDIGDTVIAYKSTDTYIRAIFVGLINSLRVMIIGIIFATILGVTIGIGRLSSNWLVRQIASVYVQTFRNTPLLLQLFFWYFAVFLKLPSIEQPLVFFNFVFLTNRGMDIPWVIGNAQTWSSLGFVLVSIILIIILGRRRTQVMVKEGKSGRILQLTIIALVIATLIVLILGLDWQKPQLDEINNSIQGGLNLSPEFATLLFGLTFYTAAFIAEVVRAGIQSVSKGQWEAAQALGLKPNLVMQLIVFPQALRVIIPPLTSEFLNLAKNSSLAIAIGYKDIYAVASTTSNQTGRSIEMLLVVMLSYLTINLIISLGMNWLNKSVQVR